MFLLKWYDALLIEYIFIFDIDNFLIFVFLFFVIFLLFFVVFVLMMFLMFFLFNLLLFRLFPQLRSLIWINRYMFLWSLRWRLHFNSSLANLKQMIETLWTLIFDSYAWFDGMSEFEVFFHANPLLLYVKTIDNTSLSTLSRNLCLILNGP